MTTGTTLPQEMILINRYEILRLVDEGYLVFRIYFAPFVQVFHGIFYPVQC